MKRASFICTQSREKSSWAGTHLFNRFWGPTLYQALLGPGTQVAKQMANSVPSSTGLSLIGKLDGSHENIRKCCRGKESMVTGGERRGEGWCLCLQDYPGRSGEWTSNWPEWRLGRFSRPEKTLTWLRAVAMEVVFREVTRTEWKENGTVCELLRGFELLEFSPKCFVYSGVVQDWKKIAWHDLWFLSY